MECFINKIKHYDLLPEPDTGFPLHRRSHLATVSIAGVVGPFHGAVTEEGEIQRVNRFFRGSVAGNYPIALPDTRSHVDVATWDLDNETPAPERPLVRSSVVDDG